MLKFGTLVEIGTLIKEEFETPKLSLLRGGPEMKG